MLRKILIYLGSIIVFFAMGSLHWIKFFQASFWELKQLNFNAVKEGLRLLFNSFDSRLGNLGKKSSDVDHLLLAVDVVTKPRGKKAEPLTFFLKLEEIVSWFWFFDGLEVVDDGKQRFFNPPLFSG